MVRFEENKLIIELQTCSPVEDWLYLQQGLCDVVRNVNQDNICSDTFCNVINFMQSLIPEWETARKMK